MDFDAVTPGIVVTVYAVVELLKYFWLKTNNQRALLPVFAVISGAAIAVAIYVLYPQGLAATNIVEAIATGGLSGIAATGCNQLWKQYQKYSGNIEGDGNLNENEVQEPPPITVPEPAPEQDEFPIQEYGTGSEDSGLGESEPAEEQMTEEAVEKPKATSLHTVAGIKVAINYGSDEAEG